MSLGFCVNDLLPRARGGGPLKMGLAALAEEEWLQPLPDLAMRAAAFDTNPESTALLPQAAPGAAELAAILGTGGGLEDAARAQWEDMCLLTRSAGEDIYRLIGAAVAFPTDWHPAQKLGLPLAALHAPIHGYAGQLASAVDRFMAKLQPGRIYGRCNWFVSPVPALRWIAGTPPQQAFAQVTPANAGKALFVRCERQTLRRLPQSGAVLFTIGVYVAPLCALTAENLARLANALATIPADEAERRGAAFYGPQLQAFAAQAAAAMPVQRSIV